MLSETTKQPPDKGQKGKVLNMEITVKEFKKRCASYIKKRYSSDAQCVFTSSCVCFGKLYLEYILLNPISHDCCPVYQIQFVSDGTIYIHRLIRDNNTTVIDEL